MKEIFDWLSNKIVTSSYEIETLGGRYINVVQEKRCLELVDKAEAKWKSDCCEYEYHVAPSKDIYFLTRCNHRHNGRLSGDRPYCGFCGKPIKIVGVE